MTKTLTEHNLNTLAKVYPHIFSAALFYNTYTRYTGIVDPKVGQGVAGQDSGSKEAVLTELLVCCLLQPQATCRIQHWQRIRAVRRKFCYLQPPMLDDCVSSRYSSQRESIRSVIAALQMQVVGKN